MSEKNHIEWIVKKLKFGYTNIVDLKKKEIRYYQGNKEIE
mgnify:CR=1 FL=1